MLGHSVALCCCVGVLSPALRELSTATMRVAKGMLAVLERSLLRAAPDPAGLC